MRNGFVRGMLVGSILGAASSVLINPRHREKAREMIDQGGQLLKDGGQIFKDAEDNILSAGNWIEKSRQLFQHEEPEFQFAEQGETGEVTDRVALLEKRLEELEHKSL